MQFGNTSNIYEFEVPQLLLKSNINLNSSNKKGGIELDWSDYDLADKYFVIYRKQENETEWETIITLEQKLTTGKYTDTLGNDKNKPQTPEINIAENQENNTIEITRGFKRHRNKIFILHRKL